MSKQSEDEDQTNKRINDGDMKEVDLERHANQQGTTKIEIREKRGILRAAIPRVSVPIAWVVLFFNVFLPGTGTLLLSLISLCGVTTDLKKQNRCLAFLINLCTGLLQTITAIIIVGWIWSVYWGMHTVTEANERSEEAKNKKRSAMVALNAEEKERLNHCDKDDDQNLAENAPEDQK